MACTNTCISAKKRAGACSKCNKDVCRSHYRQCSCNYCNQYLCSVDAFSCNSCGGGRYYCSTHSSRCAQPECGKTECNIYHSTFDVCSQLGCGKKFCPDHLKACAHSGCGKKYCAEHSHACGLLGCGTTLCLSHSPPACKICSQHFCPSHGSKCSAPACYSKYSFCVGHDTTCPKCNQIFCSSHFSPCFTCSKDHTCNPFICASCQQPYCNQHMPKHTTTADGVIYCVGGKEHGKFESHAKLQPNQDGVGTFTWPDGAKTMIWIFGGKPMITRNLSANEQMAYDLNEEKKQFEERQVTEKASRQREMKLAYDELETHKKELSSLVEAEKQKSLQEVEEEKQKSLQEVEKSLQRVEEEKQKCRQEAEELERRKSEFEADQEKGRQFIAANEDVVIKLSISGVPFQTTVGTLCKHPSKLKTMFSTLSYKKNESGEVWVDRDGTHFKYILNFMRDGVLPSALPRGVIEELKVEAKFYEMPALTSALNSYLL